MRFVVCPVSFCLPCTSFARFPWQMFLLRPPALGGRIDLGGLDRQLLFFIVATGPGFVVLAFACFQKVSAHLLQNFCLFLGRSALWIITLPAPFWKKQQLS